MRIDRNRLLSSAMAKLFPGYVLCKTDNADIDENPNSNFRSDSICSRAPSVIQGDLAPVSYLPFSPAIFKKVVQRFCVHPGIIKTIGREVTEYSSRSHFENEMGSSKIS
jgi:hypothetical protein